VNFLTSLTAYFKHFLQGMTSRSLGSLGLKSLSWERGAFNSSFKRFAFAPYNYDKRPFYPMKSSILLSIERLKLVVFNAPLKVLGTI
jgi:hypothetical protein